MITGGILGTVLNAVIIGYMILCLYFGFLHAGRIRNLKEFALGYKNISTGILVATIYATHLGAGATLGLIEQINNIGIVCVFIAMLSVARWYTTKVILCNNVGRFKGCLSQADVMEKLFGPSAFIVSNIVNVISSIGFVAIQAVVLGFVVQYFFGVSASTGILLGALVLITYSASGGIKAVILTDLMQLILFVMVIGAVFFLSVHKMTDQPDFWHLIPASKMWVMPYDMHSTFLVMGMIIYAIVPFGCGAPHMQRILISGSNQQLRKAFSYTMILDFAVIVAISCIAVLILPNTGEGSLSRVDIFNMVKDNLHPVLITASVVGIMAVTMSTADSWLNSGAVIITQSIAKWRPGIGDVQQVKIARLVTITLGIAAAYTALVGGSILEILLLTTSLELPILIIPISAGFLGYKFIEQDYKRSVALALLTVLLGAYLEGEFGFISLLFGLIGSTVGLTWSKQWRFFKADGTPIISMPEFREVTPKFYGLALSLGALSALLYSYLTPIWSIGQLSIAFSGVAAMLALLLYMYGEEYTKVQKVSAKITSMFLTSAVASMAIVTCNIGMIGIAFVSTSVTIAHRQHYPALAGLLLSALSYNMTGMSYYVPQLPFIGVVLGVSVMSMVTLCILYQGMREAYQAAYSTLQNAAHALEDKEVEIGTLNDQMSGAWKHLENVAMRLTETRQQLETSENALYYATKELKTSKQDLASTTLELGATTKFLAMANDCIEAKKLELAAAKKQLKATRQEVAAKEAELEQNCRKYGLLSKEYDKTSGALAQVRGRLEESETLFANANQQLRSTQKELSRTKIRLIDTQKKLRIERRHATIDPLTKVYNRRYMHNKVKAMIKDARDRNKDFAIAVLDLDLFKSLNDDYGEHENGDRCLKQLVSRMKTSIRRLDLSCRMGGDEFIIIMPGADLKSGAAIAERMRQAVESMPFKVKGDPSTRRCTISIGVAAYTAGDTIASLIARADKALYAAKGKGHSQAQEQGKPQGRNRVFMLDKSMKQPVGL